MKGISAILLSVFFIFGLASCGDSCQTCTLGEASAEVCEDNWEALAAEDGSDAATFDEYIANAEAFGFDCK